MKFPLNKCVDCGLDLITAEPADVRYLDDKTAIGTCPKCLRTYFMVEVTPLPESISEPEPAPRVTRVRRRRVSEPE